MLYGQLADLRARAARYAGPLAGVTVRAASKRVRTKPVVLSGELRFPDGGSPAGAPLAIQFAGPPGQAWQQVANTSCAADGRWQTTAALPRSGQVRAVFPGDAARASLISAPVSITVLPSLVLVLASRRLRAGNAVLASGTLTPPPADGRVELRLERQVGRRWVRVQRKRVNVRGGRFQTRLRTGRAGLYRVTALTPGATRRVQVRAVSATGGAAAG